MPEAGPAPGVAPPRTIVVLALSALASCLIGLAWLKWPSSLLVIEKPRASGTMAPRADLFSTDGWPAWLWPLPRAASYLYTVWKALAFGLLISASLSAFVSPRWLARLFGGGTMRGHLVAGLAGAPLMLCS